MIDRFKQKVKALLQWEKRKFLSIEKSLPFNLDYVNNIGGVHILEDIFIDQEYAHFLPTSAEIIVDIGGHYGYFSLFAAHYFSAQTRILAYEPSEKSFNYFLQNIQTSKFNNIQVYNQGVSNFIGKKALFGDRIENYNILNQGIRQIGNVEVVTLKSIMEENSLDKIDVLKLDCEGSEYEIILDSPDSILKRIEMITMEFHDRSTENISSADIIKKLTGSGMEVLKHSFSEDQSHKGLKFGRIVSRRN